MIQTARRERTKEQRDTKPRERNEQPTERRERPERMPRETRSTRPAPAERTERQSTQVTCQYRETNPSTPNVVTQPSVDTSTATDSAKSETAKPRITLAMFMRLKMMCDCA